MSDLINGKAPLWQGFLVFAIGSFLVAFASVAVDDFIPERSPAHTLALSAVAGLAFVCIVAAWRCALNTPTPLLGWLLRFWIVASIALAFGKGKVEVPPSQQPGAEYTEYLNHLKAVQGAAVND